MSDNGSYIAAKPSGIKTTNAASRSESVAQYSAAQISREEAMRRLKAAKVPLKGDSKQVDFGNGYSASFTHQSPGNGTGGIIRTVIKHNGQVITTGNIRWGGNGYATAFETKAQAWAAAKRDVEYFAMAEPDPKKRKTPF